jgi:hypothetical protein
MTTTEDVPVQHLRLQVELVLEITEARALTGAALDHIAGDDYLPADERTHAETAVRGDEAEALAYLVDPTDLVAELPGVELVQASWSCAHTDYDPDSDAWDLYETDDEGGVPGDPHGHPHDGGHDTGHDNTGHDTGHDGDRDAYGASHARE